MEWGLAHISAREFAEWMAYAGLEPFGEPRADFRHAQALQMLANVNRTEGEPYPLSAFLPEPIEPEPEDEDTDEDEPDDKPDVDPWREQQAVAAMITGAYGGQDLRQR